MNQNKKELIERLVNEVTKEELIESLYDSKKVIKELVVKHEENKPKVDFYDSVAGSDNLVDMAIVAKILNFRGMGRNRLFNYLRNKGIFRYNNEPYQTYVDKGYFKLIETIFTFPDGNRGLQVKTMTTQIGIDFIRKSLVGDGYEYNKR